MTGSRSRSNYSGPAVIIDEYDGIVPVLCSFEIVRASIDGMDSPVSWSGDFSVREPADEVTPGSVAMLRLPSGAAGSIVVTSAVGGRGSFTGSGEPPRI